MTSGPSDSSSRKPRQGTGTFQAFESSPHFRTKTKVLVFSLIFIIFIAIQGGAVLLMYGSSRGAITDVLGKRLNVAARLTTAALSIPLEQNADKSVIDGILWRVRESQLLESAMILDREGRILHCNWGAPAGTPTSAFMATPNALKDVFAKGEPVSENLVFLGDPYLRTYYPISLRGKVWGVLCLDVYDPLPEGVTSLESPLMLGLGVSFISALVVAIIATMLMRFFDKSKRELLRMERLTTTGALAASLAHEIKNPMGIILSSAQVLARSSEISEEDRELLTDIQDEVRRANDQLEIFLDLSRDMALKRKPIDINIIISKTIELVSARGRQSKVRIESTLPDTPLLVNADETKLRQVFVNLVLNSIEAIGTREDGIVGIEAQPGNAPGDNIIIKVVDNGPGISSANLQNVLEPFFSTKSSGTGLGLPRARQIVERHGGSLKIGSGAGKGTTVTIMLKPLQE